MIFDAATLGADAFYPLMLQTIVPRPIAWVLSRNAGGTFNVAPFSFFNGVSSEPPLLMISVGRRDDGTQKDTWANIAAREDFVVHVPPVEQVAAVVATSAPLPAGASELDFARLETARVEGETLPRLVGPKAAMFCRKHRIVEMGGEGMGVIFGEVRRLWVDDAAVTIAGGRTKIDPAALDPLARLGGKTYSGLGKVFDVERPR